MKESNKKNRIIVGMSGGVDSSVAAALLKKAGFDVIGIFMKFWKDGKSGKNSCCSIESEKLARLVAKKIGIPFYVLNTEKEFKKEVVNYFLKEYKNGVTPNPCVVCNREIKFGYLIKKALSLGADYVATGHYAHISLGKCFSASARPQRGLAQASAISAFGGPCKLPAGYATKYIPSLFSPCSVKLLEAKDTEKDQTYFLNQLKQSQLKHVLFPLGEYTKPEVRKLAKKFDLPTAETPESQEVCFVQNTTDEFLNKYLKNKPGKVLDISGKIVGQHNGLWFYTIGQRKGIGLSGGPFYVVGKNLKKNQLIISRNEKDLFKKEMSVKNINWISGEKPKLPIKVKVKVRYRNKPVDVILNKKNKVIFSKPIRAITPGQSAVFYKGREMLGGGVII